MSAKSAAEEFMEGPLALWVSKIPLKRTSALECIRVFYIRNAYCACVQRMNIILVCHSLFSDVPEGRATGAMAPP